MKVLSHTSRTKKPASKNIDFRRSCSSLKMAFLEGFKNANLVCGGKHCPWWRYLGQKKWTEEISLLNISSSYWSPIIFRRTNPDDYTEYYPYLAFVYTCSGPHMFELHLLHSMCEMTDKIFANSRLRIRSKLVVYYTTLETPYICSYKSLTAKGIVVSHCGPLIKSVQYLYYVRPLCTSFHCIWN